jgi:hypothetical protein
VRGREKGQVGAASEIHVSEPTALQNLPLPWLPQPSPHHGHKYVDKGRQHGPPVVPERAAQELQQQAQREGGRQAAEPAGRRAGW